MPLKRCKVLDTKEAQSTPREPPPTSLTKYLEMAEKPANESPPVYPQHHVEYRNQTSLFGILYRALPDAVGVAGMKYAFNPTEIRVRRVFWLFLVLGAMCVMAYQLVERSIHFAANPQRISVSVKYDGRKHFPSVAICNYNAFRASLVAGTPFGNFLRSYAYEGDNINWTEYQSTLEAISMTDAYLSMGHSINSSVISMRWGRETLTSANLTTKITDWGLCFIFNDKMNQLPRLSVKAGGRRHGLEVVLDTKQSEYFFEPRLRGSAGFQVVLYEYGTEPDVEDSGFAVAPGEMTLAAVGVSEVTNLPPPHGRCGRKELKHYDYYKHVECMNECRDDHVLRRCGCKTLNMRGDARECTAWEFFTCINPAHHSFMENATCRCPLECSSVTYSASVTHAEHPSAFYREAYGDIYGINESYFKDNICGISVFFKDMTVYRRHQKVAYNFFSLLCDIGGSLGLWLGGSILTVFEFLDLIGHSAYVYFRTRPDESSDPS